MPIGMVIALVVEYGPEAISLIKAIIAAVEPLFEGGAEPTEAEIRAAVAELVTEHARLQATR